MSLSDIKKIQISEVHQARKIPYSHGEDQKEAAAPFTSRKLQRRSQIGECKHR